MKKKNFNRQMFKMSPEELEEYMKFRRKGSKIDAKKGKGSYTRKQKHKDNYKLCA